MAPQDYFDTWMDDFPVTDFNEIDIARLDSGRLVFSSGRSLPASPRSVSHTAALMGMSTKGYEKKVEFFSSKPREAITDVYELYKNVRVFLKPDAQKIVDLVAKDIEDKSKNDAQTLILRYMILGECSTRLGGTLSRPTENIEDVYLDVLLDIARIVFEDRWNNKYQLPWLADDTSEFGKKRLKWEKRASDLGDYTGGALGRLVTAGAVAALQPLAKLPDEASRAIAFLFAINARKAAEVVMSREILKHPDNYPG